MRKIIETTGWYGGGLCVHVSRHTADEPHVAVQINNVLSDNGIELCVDGADMPASSVKLTFRGKEMLAALAAMGHFATKLDGGTH